MADVPVRWLAPTVRSGYNCRFRANEKRIRSGDPDVEPVDVFPTFKVYSVQSISMANERFQMELQMDFSWHDPEFCEAMKTEQWLADKAASSSWQDHMRATCWHPMVDIHNLVDVSHKETWFTVDEQRQSITFKCRLAGTFTERFELWNFPYDSQALTVSMKTMYTLNRVRFRPCPLSTMWVGKTAELGAQGETKVDSRSPVRTSSSSPSERSSSLSAYRTRDYHSLPGFILGEWYPLPLMRVRCTPSFTRSVYHMLAVEVEVRREHFFYDINYVGLAALLASISFGVVFVPVESFADRCSITLTLLLTAVAFKQIIADKIPMTSYLTLIDVYILGSLVVIGLVTIETLIAAFVFWAHNSGGWRAWRLHHQWPSGPGGGNGSDDDVADAADEEQYSHLWPGGGAEAEEWALSSSLGLEVLLLGVLLVGWLLFNVWFIFRACRLSRYTRASAVYARLVEQAGDTVANAAELITNGRSRTPQPQSNGDADDEPMVSIPADWWQDAPEWWLNDEGELACCTPDDRWERVSKQHILKNAKGDRDFAETKFEALSTLEPSGVPLGNKPARGKPPKPSRRQNRGVLGFVRRNQVRVAAVPK